MKITKDEIFEKLGQKTEDAVAELHADTLSKILVGEESTELEESKKMKDDPCWDDHEMVGHKMKDGKKVPNCVPKEDCDIEPGADRLKKLEARISESTEDDAEVFLDEDTGEHYYMELDEETLEERKIIIRINSKGQRIKRIKCPQGRVARSVNGRIVCVTPTGRERLTKKLAIKRSVRTKKAKGAGFKKRVNFKRQRALRKRRQMGLPKQEK